MNIYLFLYTIINSTGSLGPGGAASALTLESSINDGLLLEDGSYLLLEA